MTPAQGIRTLGFRRWYERQLIEGHAWFVTCFLCMIVVAACLEGFSFRAPGATPLVTLAIVLASAGLCVFAVRRYMAILERAEYLAERSTCTSCKHYGALTVLDASSDQRMRRDADARGHRQPAQRTWIKVRCRKCGHDWVIE